MDNEKLLKSKISDVKRLSGKYSQPRFSDFLDEGEIETVKLERLDLGGFFFGGFEGAKRKVLGFFPDWYERDNTDFPITVVEIIKKGDKDLSHRDYLGTVMGLGLERRKTGDIIVTDQGAYVFVIEDVASLVLGIEKVSNCGVKTRTVEFSDLVIPEPEYKIIETVAASMRLDSILSGTLKLSRKNTADFIKSGRCMVNHRVIERNDFSIKEGDTLSLRGFGRYEFLSVDGETRSGRLHIKIKKYI